KIMLSCIKRAITIGQFSIRFLRNRIGKKVETGTKSSGTVGGSPHTALQLHIFCRRSKIRKIYPKSTLAFGIVKRNSVEGNVNPRCIAASYTKITVANSRSVV